MANVRSRLFVVLLLSSVLSASVGADAPTTQATSKPATDPGDRIVVTEHESSIGGRLVRYRASTGTLRLLDDAGKPRADIFCIAYERLPLDATRPVAFVFNGGPGAASVWLHLGTCGPKRIELDDRGMVLPLPGRLVDNEESWLDLLDLVFIDPVGTGFSRAVEGQKPEQFWGVEQDASAVGDFVRAWLTRNDRWLSPKFLVGESYGTTRAARMSDLLLDRHGIALNGIVLVSMVLDFNTLRTTPTNDVPFPLYLPTYAATAWYHERLAGELQRRPLREVVAAAERFAMDEYLPALAVGDRLEVSRRAKLVADLARWTGLEPSFIDRCDLRIDPGDFRKQLLISRREVIGRFDARVTGADPDARSIGTWFDPSYTAYLALYTATMQDYVRRSLGFQSPLPYEVMGRVGGWDFNPGGGPLNVGGNLRSSMIKNPHLRVMVCSGYYDLATPHFAADITLSRLDLPPVLRNQVWTRYYEGGHMMYHVPAARVQLKRDVEQFIRAAAPGARPGPLPAR